MCSYRGVVIRIFNMSSQHYCSSDNTDLLYFLSLAIILPAIWIIINKWCLHCSMPTTSCMRTQLHKCVYLDWGHTLNNLRMIIYALSFVFFFPLSTKNVIMLTIRCWLHTSILYDVYVLYISISVRILLLIFKFFRT